MLKFPTAFATRYACFGDTISVEVEGFTVTARLEHDPDTRPEDPEGGGRYKARMRKALESWQRDEWHYVGVALSVSRSGVVLDDYAASLWGIDMNYPRKGGVDNSYLTEVANDLLEEALRSGRAVLDQLCAVAA